MSYRHIYLVYPCSNILKLKNNFDSIDLNGNGIKEKDYTLLISKYKYPVVLVPEIVVPLVEKLPKTVPVVS